MIRRSRWMPTRMRRIVDHSALAKLHPALTSIVLDSTGIVLPSGAVTTISMRNPDERPRVPAKDECSAAGPTRTRNVCSGSNPPYTDAGIGSVQSYQQQLLLPRPAATTSSELTQITVSGRSDGRRSAGGGHRPGGLSPGRSGARIRAPDRWSVFG
jgi:hypothetical protein